jgi:hypothetical protein
VGLLPIETLDTPVEGCQHHGLHNHRAVLAALRAGNAGDAERLRRPTVANIGAAAERYSAFIV